MIQHAKKKMGTEENKRNRQRRTKGICMENEREKAASVLEPTTDFSGRIFPWQQLAFLKIKRRKF